MLSMDVLEITVNTTTELTVMGFEITYRETFPSAFAIGNFKNRIKFPCSFEPVQ
jgi:hypothetical protein